MPIERHSDQYTAEDMEEVGRALMDTLHRCRDGLRGWAPADCPTEIVGDLINARDEAETALALILPMAKGYAAEHPVGSNAEYVKAAEAALAERD